MKKTRKVGGVVLKLKIAESNLGAKMLELDAVKNKLSETSNERDFLRKVVANLSEQKRYA